MADLNSEDFEKLNRSIEELTKMTSTSAIYTSAMAGNIQTMNSRGNETHKLLKKMLTSIDGLKSSLKVEQTKAKKSENTGGHKSIGDKSVGALGESTMKLNSAFTSLTDRTKNLSKTFKTLNDTVARSAQLMGQQQRGGLMNTMRSMQGGSGWNSFVNSSNQANSNRPYREDSAWRRTGQSFSSTTGGLLKSSGSNVDMVKDAVAVTETVANGLKAVAGGLSLIPNPASRAASALFALGGAAIALTVKGMSEVAQYMDSVVATHKEIMSFGAATGMTTSDMMAMAQQAGFTTKNIQEWSSTLKSNTGVITSFGGNMADGMTKMTQFINLSDDEFARFQRLGFDRQGAMAAMVDYADMLVKSGQVLTGDTASMNREARKYIDLKAKERAMLGTTIEQQQNARKEAEADDRYQAYLENMQESNPEEYKKLMALDQVFKALSTGDNPLISKEDASGLRHVISSYGGVDTESARRLTTLTNGGVFDFLNTAKESVGKKTNNEITKDIAQYITGSKTGMRRQLAGSAAYMGSGEVAKYLGVSDVSTSIAAANRAKILDPNGVELQFDNKVDANTDTFLKNQDLMTRTSFDLTKTIEGAMNTAALNSEFIRDLVGQVRKYLKTAVETMESLVAPGTAGKKIPGTTISRDNGVSLTVGAEQQEKARQKTLENVAGYRTGWTSVEQYDTAIQRLENTKNPRRDVINELKKERAARFPNSTSTSLSAPQGNGGPLVPFNNDFQRSGAYLNPQIQKFIDDHRTNTGLAGFTGANDEFHKDLGGAHPKGNALDFTLKDSSPENRKKWISYLQGMGFHVLDEYEKPSAHATGNHLHIATQPGAEGTTVPKTSDMKMKNGKENISSAPTSASNDTKVSLNSDNNSMLDELRMMRRTLANIETSLA